jgi:alkylhydroperoxidase family enzyme
MDSNAAGGSKEGASDEKIAAVAQSATSELFTPAERVALELAEAMTATPPNVTDELFARLQTFYDEAQLVELVAIVCQENFRARSNTTFRVESEGMYCVAPGAVSGDQSNVSR